MIETTKKPVDNLTGFLNFFSKIIIYLIGFSLLVSGIILLVGGNLKESRIILLFVSIITFLFLHWEFRKVDGLNYKKVSIYFCISASIILLLTLIVTQIYDKSWDGMSYHQTAIFEFSQGWNPIYKPLPLVDIHTNYFEEKIMPNLWINHYAKGFELVAALFMGLFNNIESGKVINILLLLSSFCSVYHLLLNVKGIGKFWSFIISLAASFNPILINQIFSYYLDGAIGALLLMLIVQFISLAISKKEQDNYPRYINIFFLLIILINFKFTGLVYAGCISIVFFSYLLFVKNIVLLKGFVVASAVGVFFAIVVAGFNPYITNTFKNGHPFYPLAGKNKIDIISYNIPTQLKEENGIVKFVSSTFSPSENWDRRHGNEKMKVKIPFTFKRKEVLAFQSEGIRLGGFGVFWSGIFIASVVFLLIGLFRIKEKGRIYLLFTIIALVGSVAINAEAWWARYVPQLWLIPVTLCFFMLFFMDNKIVKYSSKIILVLLLLNSLVIFAVYTYSSVITTFRANQQFAQLKNSKQPIKVYFDMFPSNALKFQKKNIAFITVEDRRALACNQMIKGLRIEYCSEE